MAEKEPYLEICRSLSTQHAICLVFKLKVHVKSDLGIHVFFSKCCVLKSIKYEMLGIIYKHILKSKLCVYHEVNIT